MPELERVHKASVKKLSAPKSICRKKSAGTAISADSKDVERVFLQRSMNAVIELTRLNKGDLLHAISEPTDSGVLLNALKIAVDQSNSKTPRNQVPTLFQAKFRGVTAMRQLLGAFGGAISVENVSNHLGLTRQGVDKRRKNGQLLAVELGKRGYLYPSWQFTKSGTQKGLEEVLGALAAYDPWTQLAFFVNPNDRLAGKSPVEALQENRLEAVLAAAEMYGKHGAA